MAFVYCKKKKIKQILINTENVQTNEYPSSSNPGSGSEKEKLGNFEVFP